MTCKWLISMVNNKSPIPGVVPLPNGRFMANWDDPPRSRSFPLRWTGWTWRTGSHDSDTWLMSMVIGDIPYKTGLMMLMGPLPNGVFSWLS